ncbi:uncharacterized protein LOC144667293 [Oculina patagonica]
MTCLARHSWLTATLVFTLLYTDVVVTKGCDHLRRGNLLEKSSCAGYQVGVRSVWTEIQCLDNCLRHPHCDKFIFYGQENQNCKFVHTGDMSNVPGAADLPEISGQCAPKKGRKSRCIS